MKTGVVGSSEKLATFYQITWYFSRTLILLLVMWIGLALWSKHVRTVIVLQLFVAEIFPLFVKYV